MRFTLCLFACSLVMLLTGCFSENEQIDISALEKDWKVVSAKRDGKLTSTLDGVYLNFGEKMLKTNYLMREVEGPYIFNEEESTIYFGKNHDQLKVYYLSSDSMHLSTIIRDTKFDFFMN